MGQPITSVSRAILALLLVFIAFTGASPAGKSSSTSCTTTNKSTSKTTSTSTSKATTTSTSKATTSSTRQATTTTTTKTTTTATPTATPSFCPAGYHEYVLSNQDCNFENFGEVLVSEDVPMGYCGLDMQSLQVLTFGAVPGLGVSGVQPHSGNNYVLTDAQDQTSGGAILLTVHYPGSTAVDFDLESFWFGCAIEDQDSGAYLPVACNLGLGGFRGSDNSVSDSSEICSDFASYNPSSNVGIQQMTFKAVNSACQHLSFAQFIFSVEPGLAASQVDVALLFDDVVVTTRGCNSTSS